MSLVQDDDEIEDPDPIKRLKNGLREDDGSVTFSSSPPELTAAIILERDRLQKAKSDGERIINGAYLNAGLPYWPMREVSAILLSANE